MTPVTLLKQPSNVRSPRWFEPKHQGPTQTSTETSGHVHRERETCEASAPGGGGKAPATGCETLTEERALEAARARPRAPGDEGKPLARSMQLRSGWHLRPAQRCCVQPTLPDGPGGAPSRLCRNWSPGLPRTPPRSRGPEHGERSGPGPRLQGAAVQAAAKTCRLGPRLACRGLALLRCRQSQQSGRWSGTRGLRAGPPPRKGP